MSLCVHGLDFLTGGSLAHGLCLLPVSLRLHSERGGARVLSYPPYPPQGPPVAVVYVYRKYQLEVSYFKSEAVGNLCK